MPKPEKPKNDDDEQSKRFIETAKGLKSDESGKLFERAISVVTKGSKNASNHKKRR